MINFKNKKLIIILSVVAAVLVALAAVVVFAGKPQIKIVGEQGANVEVFSDYASQGAEGCVNILGIKIPSEVETVGEADIKALGNYTITYTTQFLWKTASASQNVNVVDTTVPTLTLAQDTFSVEYGNTVPTPDDIKVNCTATDLYDGDITAGIVKTVEGNICYFSATDSSGNTGVAQVEIRYIDVAAPTIHLSGSATAYVLSGKPFTEPGYSASDNVDGDLTAKVTVTGTVDTSKSGTYYREYTVTDKAGNTAKVTRKIIVFGTLTASDFGDITPNGKTIYLTFDDGPGAYTATLLETLRRYDVKATFFVTNQFPKYQYLIGAAHNDGHTIALHTQTHRWSIYSSVDSYMADFNAMQDIITAQTGSPTRIFRFPGGTSNTVSRSYCKGIMTTLSQKMINDGFVYFDWNVDSNDTRYNTAQGVIDSTIAQLGSKTNAVVLMHDIKKHTVDAVPAIIEYGLQNGYTFKALSPDSPSVKFRPNN